MNGTQVQTTLAPIIGFIAGLLAGKGVFGLDAGTWTTIIGALAAAIATVWGAVAARKTAIVTTAANMPEVASIKLDPTAAGTASLNEATPNNVKVGA